MRKKSLEERIGEVVEKKLRAEIDSMFKEIVEFVNTAETDRAVIKDFLEGKELVGDPNLSVELYRKDGTQSNATALEAIEAIKEAMFNRDIDKALTKAYDNLLKRASREGE